MPAKHPLPLAAFSIRALCSMSPYQLKVSQLQRKNSWLWTSFSEEFKVLAQDVEFSCLTWFRKFSASSLGLVLRQGYRIDFHKISKSFFNSTIKAQSLFWRSSLNQSLQASMDSLDICKKDNIFIERPFRERCIGSSKLKNPPCWSPCPFRQNDDQTF